VLTTLLLADGRFPAGGHAHSAGIEAAVADGRVHDLRSLQGFLTGRLSTTGLGDAAVSATAVLSAGRVDDDPARCVEGWCLLDAETAVRIASPALREASRRQGRQLLRTGRAVWPDERLHALGAAVGPDGGPHLPVAFGAVAAVAGLTPDEVAAAALHHATSGPATAAVRLLGLDPVGVTLIQARLAPMSDALAGSAVAAARRALGPPLALYSLPAASTPVVELAADDHATWEVRLFAS
jgi:urease accessory protein